MSLNFVIPSLAHLAHSPMHRRRLRQSGREHVGERWCEIQKTGKVPLPNNVPYNVHEVKVTQN